MLESKKDITIEQNLKKNKIWFWKKNKVWYNRDFIEIFFGKTSGKSKNKALEEMFKILIYCKNKTEQIKISCFSNILFKVLVKLLKE